MEEREELDEREKERNRDEREVRALFRTCLMRTMYMAVATLHKKAYNPNQNQNALE